MDRRSAVTCHLLSRSSPLCPIAVVSVASRPSYLIIVIFIKGVRLGVHGDTWKGHRSDDSFSDKRGRATPRFYRSISSRNEYYSILPRTRYQTMAKVAASSPLVQANLATTCCGCSESSQQPNKPNCHFALILERYYFFPFIPRNERSMDERKAERKRHRHNHSKIIEKQGRARGG